MASPQLEDGFLRLANEIAEALARTPLRPGENQIIGAVFRKTFGWNKPEDAISIGQLVELTGLSRRWVITTLQNLEAKRMLRVTRRKGRGHKNEINLISFNKNHDEWVVKGKSPQYEKDLKRRTLSYIKSGERGGEGTGGSEGNRQGVVKGSCTHKRHLQKTLFVEGSQELRLVDLLFTCITENNPGHKVPNRQVWAKSIDLMLRRDKRDSGKVEKVIRWCQQDAFWKSNILSTAKLRRQFDQLFMKMEQESPVIDLT